MRTETHIREGLARVGKIAVRELELVLESGGLLLAELELELGDVLLGAEVADDFTQLGNAATVAAIAVVGGSGRAVGAGGVTLVLEARGVRADRLEVRVESGVLIVEFRSAARQDQASAE